jgi:hypothetical protein
LTEKRIILCFSNQSGSKMEFPEEEKIRIRHYFLNRLDETLNQQIEEKFMTSADYKDQMLIGEAELLEDYESGRLTASERAALEQRLQLKEDPPGQLAAIRALRAYAQRQPPVQISTAVSRQTQPANSFFRRLALWFRSPASAVAAVALMLAVGLAIWILRLAPQREELARRQALEREALRLNPDIGAPLPTELTQPGAQLLSLTLSPQRLRGGGAIPSVAIHDQRAIVQFHLNLPITKYRSYRFTLLSGDSRELINLDPLPPRTAGDATQLVVNLPSAALPAGDYQIRLSGKSADGQLEDIGNYYCQVVWPNLR